MIIKFDKVFFKYLFLIFLIFIDCSILLLIKNSYDYFLIYILLNIIFFIPICLKLSIKSNVILSLFMMIFVKFFIELFIYYFGKSVFFEAQYLYLIPLCISFIKSIKQKLNKLHLFLIIFFIINIIVNLSFNLVDFKNFIEININIFTFIFFYFIIHNNNIFKDLKKVYIFLFCISFCATILQTALDFHQDMRNGVFGLYGLTFLNFFALCYPLEQLKNANKKSWIKFVFSILITVVYFICTESKAPIILFFVVLALIVFIENKFSIKKIFIILSIICIIPISYNLMIKYNPQFAYLNNFNSIISYFTKNNNWSYKYNRFEALNNVWSQRTINEKMFGIGLGSSTPISRNYDIKLQRTLYEPYYIKLYGYNYGFQLTSLSTILLDGGILFLIILLIYLIKIGITNVINLRSKNKSFFNRIHFATYIFLLYFMIYGNIFTNYSVMAIIAILLAINNTK